MAAEQEGGLFFPEKQVLEERFHVTVTVGEELNLRPWCNRASKRSFVRPLHRQESSERSSCELL